MASKDMRMTESSSVVNIREFTARLHSHKIDNNSHGLGLKAVQLC